MTSLAHAWRHEAACRDMDSELFFPTKRGHDADYRLPLSICRSCVVRQACLADALKTETTAGGMHGMRGGLTPEERARLVKR